MNPYAFSGPAFLVFYLGLFVVVLVVAFVLDRQAREGKTRGASSDPGPYDLAYVRGGPGACVAAVLVRLETDRLIREVDDGDGDLLIEQIPAGADPAEIAVIEAIEPESGIEGRQPLRRAHQQDVIEMFDRAGEITEDVEARVVEQGLLVDLAEHKRLRTRFLLLQAIVVVAGVVRVVQGISNDRPVVFLVVAILVVGIVGFVASRFLRRVTRRGREALARETERSAALKETAGSTDRALDGQDAALACALFGVGALAAGSYFLASPISDALTRISAGAAGGCGSTWSCGTDSGCGSSCSSSCGGGCGGGCGGCGGCGG